MYRLKLLADGIHSYYFAMILSRIVAVLEAIMTGCRGFCFRNSSRYNLMACGE